MTIPEYLARIESRSGTSVPRYRHCHFGSNISSAAMSAIASVNRSLSGHSMNAGRVRMAAMCTA